MFETGSQNKYWTFTETQLSQMRTEQNEKFIEKHGARIDPKIRNSFFLNDEEERALLVSYEHKLHDFCRRFDPPMPRSVVGTAMHYFKRFYLKNSAMDYHPKEIVATCVYLACKVDEFNVSINAFVMNIKGDKNKAMDVILSNELLLMQQIDYYLTIHNPYRPIEGFLIDIKARNIIQNAERLRPHIDGFIERIFFTDAVLMYAPSQIALAAVLFAASKEGENLDNYVTQNLFRSAREKLPVFVDAVRKIRRLERIYVKPSSDVVQELDVKLNTCRNEENNPDSEIYKERMRKLYCDDDLEFLQDSSFHITDTSGEGASPSE